MRPATKHRADNRRWFVLYTAMYLCCAAVLLAIAFSCHKTLIWRADGLKQHYTVLGYLGGALRDLIAGKGWRMLSFSLGQGMDLLTTCSYYGYTDPLSLLAVFFQGEGVETVYMLTDLLRLYLAGVSFALYARGLRLKGSVRIACAAMVYAFTGSCIVLLGRHPYFINGNLYLPLLLLGVERILRDRRWLTFTLVTALMLVVNFYFAYMNTVAAILYIIVRLIARLSARGVKESAIDGAMLLAGYLLGAALSAVVFLPIVLVYLKNSRLGIAAGYSGSMLHYDRSYYIDLFRNLFVPWESVNNYHQFNYIPLAFFGLMGLWCTRGKRARQTRIALYLCGAAACLPIAAYWLNGGAYVSNRWNYIMGFFVALGCCIGMPRLSHKQGRARRVAAVIAFAYALVQLVALIALKKRKALLIVPVLTMAFAVLPALADRFPARRMTGRTAKAVLAAATTVMCMANLFIEYHPLGKNYIAQQMDAGSAYAQVRAHAIPDAIGDAGTCRIAHDLYDDPHSLLLGYNGTSFYWSLVDGKMSEYYRNLALASQTKAYQIFGLGSASALNELAAVKYFIRTEAPESAVPADYRLMDEVTVGPDRTAQIYENPIALPLGYTYTACMSEARYEALPVEEKLQALAQYAIVEGASETPAIIAVSDSNWKSEAGDLPFEVTELSGVNMDGNTVECTAAQGRMSLSFNAPEDSEVYLIFEGIRPLSKIGDDNAIRVESASGTSLASIPNPQSNFYFPKESVCVCVGSGALNRCQVVFPDPAKYHFDRLRMAYVPLTVYRQAFAERQAESLTDVVLSRDRISGNLQATGECILQIAIPCSDGWHCRIDGVEAPLFRCGGMYMGVTVEAGRHTVELTYTTPGLKTGACISAAALAIIIALSLLKCRRRAGEASAE